MLLICLAFLSAFLVVLLFRGDFSQLDARINLWVPSIQSSNFTGIALVISGVFDTYSLLVISVIAAAFLFFKNHKEESVLLLVTMGGIALIIETLKILVHSPRPLNALIFDSSFSFPSGHTAGTTVFCGLLAYFVWQHWKTSKPRQLIAVSVVTVASVVGFDRIYLNVHWFSDVLGGYTLGIFWVAFSILVFELLRKNGAFHSKNFNAISKTLLCLSIITGLGVIFTQFLPYQTIIRDLTGFYIGCYFPLVP